MTLFETLPSYDQSLSVQFCAFGAQFSFYGGAAQPLLVEIVATIALERERERERGLLLVIQGTNKTKRAVPSWSEPKNSLVTRRYQIVQFESYGIFVCVVLFRILCI